MLLQQNNNGIIEFDGMNEILLPIEVGGLKFDRIKANSPKC